MSKTISNKDKITTLISMILVALLIIFLGLSFSFNPSLRYVDRITTQTILSLGPTITFAIVVFIGIYTMDLLKTKQPTNNNKTKNLVKKVIKKSTIIGIVVIIVFGILWSSFIASTFSPPIEYPQIYINADGQVQPSTTQIKQEGSLYTLQADIYLNKFYIEKNDIILDGNGYNIKIVGPGRYRSDYNLGYFELSQVKNVTLQNLNLTDTRLVVLNSEHCKIQNTNFLTYEIKNSNYILLSQSSHLTAPQPYAGSGTPGGVTIYESANCTISHNKISNLKLTGSYNNKILYNQITSGRDRLFSHVLLWFENSSSNILFCNQINSSTNKLFSITEQTSDNLIVANNFEGHSNFEPTFNCTGTNTLYHNNFFNAYWNSSDPDFTVSNWDDGLTGNYWSNYKGPDQNNDGVGDVPYLIDQNNQDIYPLTNPVKTDKEIQPQLPLCDQKPNPYNTQITQDDSPQTPVMAILVIATIIAVSLIFYKRKQLKSIFQK